MEGAGGGGGDSVRYMDGEEEVLCCPFLRVDPSSLKEHLSMEPYPQSHTP